MQDGVGGTSAGERGNIVWQFVEASADGLSRAGSAWAGKVGGLDVQVPVPERAVVARAVDIGPIVIDGAASQGVLELRDDGDGIVARYLERDTAVGRSVVDFAVAATRRDDDWALRVALRVDGPHVRVELAVVDDDGTALGRNGGHSSSHGRDNGESLHGDLAVKAIELQYVVEVDV